ncbi:hypothetical protein EUX98_g4746 [Antrodiella citrinella]|uniref:BTB domain-containing protein n=1 Tax=Antrodiella citrinella TaxID=2447956 RepID=A0A4S4MT78_9APHY|nr:hypothetical protein EUX98_g4746 [Antrodiella citrinella]
MGPQPSRPIYTSPSVLPIPSDIPRNKILQIAATASLTGGTFIDTKFYAFSQRQASSGKGNKPLALFANSTVLRAACPYFDDLLSQRGFEENKLVNIDEDYPADRTANNDQYDDDDSDLEEDSEEDGVAATFEQLDSETASLDSSRKFDDTKTSEPKWQQNGCSLSFGAQASDAVSKTARNGHVIHVSDFAHQTLHAFIFYLYTEDIVFKPLRSSKTEKSESAVNTVSPNAPSCSPKSLYRLADRYGHQKLKELCEKEIQRQLNEQNIIAEIFSKFSWRYSPIRDMQLDYLCQFCNNDTVNAALPALTAQIAEGSLPHCAEVLNLVMSRLMRK